MTVHALRAVEFKRWRTSPRLASFENISGLTRFDYSQIVNPQIAVTTGALTGNLITTSIWNAHHQWQHLYAYTAIVAGWIFVYRFALGSLSLNTVGIEERWPGGDAKIPWDAILAVYCEHSGMYRYFVVVSADATITLPASLLRNRVAIRRFFSGIPDGTPMVGFPDDPRTLFKRKRRWRLRRSRTQRQLVPT